MNSEPLSPAPSPLLGQPLGVELSEPTVRDAARNPEGTEPSARAITPVEVS